MTYYSCPDLRELDCTDLKIRSSGPRGIRTPDLLNAIETRSQLRYGPGYGNQLFMFIWTVDSAHCPVDLRGFEPLTSSVRLRRAPNCATGPFTRRMTFYLMQEGMSRRVCNVITGVRDFGLTCAAGFIIM